MAKLDLSFNINDKSKSGEIKNTYSLSIIVVLLSFAWFAFLVIGAACYNNWGGNPDTYRAGQAFLALFGITWGAILAFCILAILSTADLQSKKDVKYGTELLAFSICMIFLPIIFGFITAIYAKKAMDANTKVSNETSAKA